MTDPKSTPESLDRPLTVCVVSHTHWDREWYHSAGRFRQGLVALVDALLTGNIRGAFPFLLDGQAVVLEDYLSVRPERASELGDRLRSGELEAGPWYVLADGLIPSGEAIVRNLLVGRRVLDRFGATAPTVAYCPDTFGHSAAIPTIAKGFGFPVAIVWRGYGGARWPKKDVAIWAGADGSEVLLYHLPPDGYETGSALPADSSIAATRWESLHALMRVRSGSGVVLLPNGADHHALQPDVAAAVEALAKAAAPDTVVRTSLQEFAARVHAAAQSNLPLPKVHGELRDSYGYTWTLNGTFGTRAHQKRANARAERLLVRDAEPWTVLAWLHGGDVARDVSARARSTLAQIPALLDANWRTLLRAHPHDTLCGCSIDTVARAMDVRIESVMTQAKGLRLSALQLALGHDAVSARSQPLTTPTLVIRNRAARSRGGIAEVLLDETIADVPVGPSSASGDVETVRLAGVPNVAAFPLQVLRSREVYRRRESPQHYPDNDRVREHRALLWVPAVPALGVAMHAITWSARDDQCAGTSASADAMAADAIDVDEEQGHRSQVPDDPYADKSAAELLTDVQQTQAAGHGNWPFQAWLRHTPEGIELGNSRLKIAASVHGVRLHAGDRTLERAVTFESTYDGGDSYTPSIRGEPEMLRCVKVRAGHAGPLRASVLVHWRTSRRKNGVHVRTELVLDAESDMVRVDILVHNQRRDHRLRVNFNTDVIAEHSAVDVWADAAFGPVSRPLLAVPLRDQSRETVPATMPMHRWATISNDKHGATLHADGLAEVEANRVNGSISLTLLRAIGQLSRNDLPERPGHAGWPAAIPLAQSLGEFHARIGLQLHDTWSQSARDAIEDASDALLLPLAGDTWRDLRTNAHTIPGPMLEGAALRMSAVTLADDGDGIVLRCVNDSEVPQQGAWILPTVAEFEFASARLDESVQSEWQRSGSRYEFTAQPRAVVTVRARHVR